MAFTVTNIIGGNTLDLIPTWTWGGLSGHRVQINGLNPIDTTISMSKLQLLLNNKPVELKNPIRSYTDPSSSINILICSVYLNGINVLDYFPELKSQGYVS